PRSRRGSSLRRIAAPMSRVVTRRYPLVGAPSPSWHSVSSRCQQNARPAPSRYCPGAKEAVKGPRGSVVREIPTASWSSTTNLTAAPERCIRHFVESRVFHRAVTTAAVLQLIEITFAASGTGVDMNRTQVERQGRCDGLRRDAATSDISQNV